MSLSGSALTVLHGLGYEWTAVSDWAMWEFEGQAVSALLHAYEV